MSDSPPLYSSEWFAENPENDPRVTDDPEPSPLPEDRSRVNQGQWQRSGVTGDWMWMEPGHTFTAPTAPDYAGSPPGTSSGGGTGGGGTDGGGDTGGNLPDALPSSLLPPSLSDSPLADWAWEQLSQGRSIPYIEQAMRDRPEFQSRFPAIERIADQGLVPPSPEEYVRFEQQVAQVASQIDLPSGATSRSNVADLLSNQVSPQQLSAFPQLRNRFRVMGLEDDLGDWAWNQLTQGRSVDQIQFDMEDTSAFRSRFPAIPEMREQGVNPPSPEEYMRFEDDVRSLVRRFDLPDRFSSQDRVTQLLTNEVRAPELETRLQTLSQEILPRSDEIKEFYASNYGVQGLSDGAILASAMSPGEPPHTFEQEIRSAQVGGTAAEHGFTRSPQRARELAERGVGLEQARQLFTRAEDRVPDFQTLVRRHNDPDDEFSLRDFEEATVFGDPEATSRMERLLAQEQAMFSGGASFQQTQEGDVVGLRPQ